MFSKRQLIEMLERTPPLVEGFINREQQVQQSGIDFTLQQVEKFKNSGQIDFDNSERKLPDTEPIPKNNGWFILPPGVYKARFNEIVHLPTTIIGIARPRSTLLRCGASMSTSLWDPGYEGRSESLLNVMNPHGIRLKQNAKIMQMIFLPLSEATEAYKGKYQGENIKK